MRLASRVRSRAPENKDANKVEMQVFNGKVMAKRIDFSQKGKLPTTKSIENLKEASEIKVHPIKKEISLNGA